MTTATKDWKKQTLGRQVREGESVELKGVKEQEEISAALGQEAKGHEEASGWTGVTPLGRASTIHTTA